MEQHICIECCRKREDISESGEDDLPGEFLRMDDVDSETEHSILHHAASVNHINCVLALMSEGIDVNLKAHPSQRTPLTPAAKNGHVQMTKLLLEKGADVNAKDEHSKSALYYAVGNGHTPCVTALLDAGADILIRDKYVRHTPLQVAVDYGRIACIRELQKHGAKFNLFDSANNWFLFGLTMRQLESPVLEEMLMIMLEEEGTLPMEFFSGIVGTNDPALLRRFLDRNIVFRESNRRHSNYNAALHSSAEECSALTFEVLLQNKETLGLKIDVPYDIDSRTLLQKSCDQDCDISIVESILKHGGNPNGVGKGPDADRPPIFVCLRTLSYNKLGLKILCTLIRYGADIEQRCTMNIKSRVITPNIKLLPVPVSVTPLEYAVFGDNLYAARVLIQAGAQKFDPTYSMFIPHKRLVHKSLAAHKAEKLTFIKDELQRPSSLYQQSRIAIRRCLGSDADSKVRSLPVAKHVQSFLLYHDLENIAEEFECRMSDITHGTDDDISEGSLCSDLSFPFTDSEDFTSEGDSDDDDDDDDDYAPQNL